MNNIIQSTISDDLCIGCGICAVVCPAQAIEMAICEEKYPKPNLDPNQCISCSLCVKYCPNSFQRIVQESEKVSDYADYNEFGIKDAYYYLGYDKNVDNRKKSASGGVATYIAERMLSEGVVEAVVHAEMISGKTGEPHYHACISSSTEEIHSRRSSFYCSISFDRVLSEVNEKRYSSILLIGTPCIVRGIKYLFHDHKPYKGITLYSIALSCSHNVNGLFTDYLADSLGISREEMYNVDLRNKDDILDANNFNNHFFDSDKSITKINRFKSQFTKQWRSYCFSMNVCNACSDFWGYEADISIKDAWGKWSRDPLGKSIIIFRNKLLYQMLNNDEGLYIESLSKYDIIDCQKATVMFKQKSAKKRIKVDNVAELNRITIQHRLNSFLRRYSIQQYKLMSVNGYNENIIKKVNQISMITDYNPINIARRVLRKVAKKWR